MAPRSSIKGAGGLGRGEVGVGTVGLLRHSEPSSPFCFSFRWDGTRARLTVTEPLCAQQEVGAGRPEGQ